MSTYANVTELDLTKLRELSEEQKNQRTFKFKKRISQQTHDIKLAENLSTMTEKLEEVKESNKKLGEVIEKSQPEINIPQPAIEHTPPHEPIENDEGVIYETEFENTLKNMRSITGFSKHENPQHGWMRKYYFIKILGGTEVQIDHKNYNITPAIRKVLVDSS